MQRKLSVIGDCKDIDCRGRKQKDEVSKARTEVEQMPKAAAVAAAQTLQKPSWGECIWLGVSRKTLSPWGTRNC
jgi:hypothetical protein